MTRSTLSRSSHAQRSSMRGMRARSPRNRSIRARSPIGRSTSRGRSPIHQSSIRAFSPSRRRTAGRTDLGGRLSNFRQSGNAIRGSGRNVRANMTRRRNKRTKWRQNKKKRRRGRGMAGRNAQGSENNAARLRMDDYMPPRTNRGHGANREMDIDRAVARARREASARTKDVFWTKKLLDAEQTHPRSTSRRWMHSGFKEMYKEELGYSEAEQSDRRHSGDKRRSDAKLRRDVSSLDRRSSPVHSKRKNSRSPIRRNRKKSKSPVLKSSRSPQKTDSSRLRQRSLSRSPSSNSSISSSSFSDSYSSYSRSTSGSSMTGTSSVSSISFQRRKKRSRSPSPKRAPRNPPISSPKAKAPVPRAPQLKVVSKSAAKLRPDRAAAPSDGSHYRRSPELRPVSQITGNGPSPAKRFEHEETSRRPPENKLISQKFTFTQPTHSEGEDTDSDSSSVNDGPSKMSLSERFGKLAQLSSQRQEYEGIRMKIVRQGGQDKRVYLEGRPAIATRPSSPRKSRSKGAHEKWLREHKAEYDDYEKRYGEFRQWDPHRDLPRDLPLNWDDVNVRYRFYKESGYFGERNITMEDYLKWEEWWYRYRDWLEKYDGSHERDTRNGVLSYESSRISSSLWSRDRDDRKRRRY